MPYQESGLYVARKPHVLFRRLVYMLGDGALDWINYDILMSQLRREIEVKQEIIDEELDFVYTTMKKRHNYSEAIKSVRNWWERVVNIPRRRIYLVTPLASKPRTREEPDEILPDFHKDPLAPTMKNTPVLKEFLEREGLSDVSYLVFLDVLYMPFKIMPEEDIGVEALPYDLQEWYHPHVVSYNVFDPEETIQRLIKIVERKKLEGLTDLTDDEKLVTNPITRESFKEYLRHCTEINKAMLSLQLHHLFPEQVVQESIVIVYGLYDDLEPFNLVKRVFNKREGIIDDYPNPDIVGIEPEERRSLYVNPLVGVTDQRTKAAILKNGLSDKRAIASLKSALDYLLKVNA